MTEKFSHAPLLRAGPGPCVSCGRAPDPSARAASLSAVKAASDTVRRLLEVGGPFAKDAETLSGVVETLA